VRAAFPLLVVLSIACAGQQQGAPVAKLSPQHEARCRELADSVLANVPREKLPRAARESAPVVVRRVVSATPPPPSVRVRIAFLVRPDGSGDPTTITITGADEARFKRNAIEIVSRISLAPATIDGCPVWSLGTITRHFWTD